MVRTFRAVTFLACFACARLAYPQSATGHIAGVVTDDQGTPVSGVFVTAHGTEQSKRIQTDGEGRYLLDLIAGRYVLTAALDGYTTVVRNGFMVKVGKIGTAPFVMKNAEAVNAQPQTPAPAPARISRFRGLNAGTIEGMLPSYNPIESLPPATAVLVEPSGRQIRR